MNIIDVMYVCLVLKIIFIVLVLGLIMFSSRTFALFEKSQTLMDVFFILSGTTFVLGLWGVAFIWVYDIDDIFHLGLMITTSIDVILLGVMLILYVLSVLCNLISGCRR